ncbi:hypothetical protein LSTR_LSTR013640, partial [Laodelphax striatellus]
IVTNMTSYYTLTLLIMWIGFELTQGAKTTRFDFRVFDVNKDNNFDQNDLTKLESFAKFKKYWKNEQDIIKIKEVLTEILNKETTNCIDREKWNAIKQDIIEKYNRKNYENNFEER